MRKTLMGGLMLALVLAGCGGTAQTKAIVKESLPLPPKSAAQTAACENDFGFDLFRAAADPAQNSAMSPNSLAVALAMVAAGANGPTQQQLLDALHLHGASGASVSASIGGLLRELQGRNGSGVKFVEADRAWVDKELKLLASYTGTLTRDFGAELGKIDFRDTQGAAAAINDWVSAQTHGKITKLVTADGLAEASLVLTNAVYLDAKWAHQFIANDTRPAPFHRADGTTVDVPTMNQRETFAIGTGPGWRAIALPYEGNKIEMDVIIPDGDLAGFERQLNAAGLDAIVHHLGPQEVDLYLPKFSVRSHFDNMRDALGKLGVKDAFDEHRADLSGMTGARDQFVKAVVHESFVRVDEKGTEAAAATGVVVMPVSMPARLSEFRVDKPFVFLVRDTVTGAVLFMGHVVDPSQAA